MFISSYLDMFQIKEVFCCNSVLIFIISIDTFLIDGCGYNRVLMYC
jgi:hypothetical protein